MVITIQNFDRLADKSSVDAVVLFVSQAEGPRWAEIEALREASNFLTPLFSSGDFTGAKDSIAVVYAAGSRITRIVLVGLGDREKVSVETLRRAGASAFQRATSMGCTRIGVAMPLDLMLEPELSAQAIVEGGILGSYSFDKYFTERFEKTPRRSIDKVIFMIHDADLRKQVKSGIFVGQTIAEGVVLARDLANAPPNEIFPESLADRARSLELVGVKVRTLGKSQIEKLGMGGLSAVGQGSNRPPSFIIMEWKGGKQDAAPVVLIGKGVTFDSGGISIKPGAGMADMKMDMGGAVAVIGSIYAAAVLKLDLHIVGLVPAAENLPSGTAYMPGDVLTLMNGKTVEVDNTDAEGRLILADALTYASRYKPQAVIDLATLTGACVVALGHFASALLGNDPELNSRIKIASERSFDRVVELPLWDEYEELIKSDIADVKNSGGRAAGTISAALFLKHFIGPYSWAHLDIAGSGMTPRANGYINKGGTGAGVRLLIDLLRNWEVN